MASNQNLRDLQWLLQSIQTQSLNLKSISFHLSQPTSCCHQQTHDSIHINISTESHFQFSNILTLLSSCSNTRFSLQNLEFYRVQWDVEEVRNLEILLDNSSNVKRVEFKKNKLSFECMDGLAKILKKNNVIKEIVLSESRIGSYGACLIASALKVNTCLEELQIWEDSIGSKGAEEISKMIEANSTLKVLTIFDSSSITATPLISAVLARNRSMEVHVWSGEHGKDSSSKVVEFAPESSTLRIYRLTVSGACRVACALGWNTTVKSLDLTGVRLRSRWAKEFRWVLEQNRSLKEVYLTKTCLKNKGVVYVAAGLFKNRSLETLHLDDNRFNGVGVEHLLCPLTRFSTLQIQANITLKSITFGGKRTKIGRVGLIAILQMLSSNQTVTRLGCKGVDGDLVLKTIMETLQVNPWIEEIDIARTPLQICGKAEEIYLKLGQNAKSEHEPEVDLLKDMPMTVPKSCRIFICGQEFAGKTTLCNSISQNLSSPKLPYIDQVKTLVNPVEQAIKTTGMKVKTFKDEDTKLSIWNLGGHHELFSVHDLMFPGHGSASFFVVVSSLFRKPNNREPKSPSELEEDLQYWLRFIVSNSKRADQQCMLPNVTMVLTHHDKVDSTSLDFQHTVNAVQRVRDKFQGYVDFYPTVFTVDARSSASVSKLTHHIRKTSKTVLQRVPRVYELCNDLITILSDWRTENHDKPAMRWREFSELCQIRVPSLRVQSRSSHVVKRVEMRRKAVAACLHSIGEVIYFEELEFLILDFQWFCGEVIGQLVKLNARKTSSNEGVSGGFVSRKELEKILRGSLHSQIPGMGSKIFGNLDASDLVNMMLKLELCYKQDPSDPESLLLIPSLLEENRTRIPIWQLVTSDCVFAGRHLECHDSSHMFLTPGFFPKLQVQLHNKIIGLKSQHGATYSLEKHLILININGIHIRVELGGQLGYYIDILACSTKNLTETIKLFRELLYPPIQNLCPGFDFDRKHHSSRMRQKSNTPTIPKNPIYSMYDYQHTWSPVSDSGRPVLGSGFDFARDLLSDDDFREVLHRRYHDLYNLAVELQVPTETDSDVNRPQQDESSKVDPSFTGIAKGVEEVIQRLKIIEMEIRDLKQEIQGLRYYEHRLLTELHRKVNYIANYNVQIEERKVPNMFYFVKTENYSRRLVTNMISGMTALRLHMLCEFRGEMHVVEDQMGCEMMQVDNRAVISLAPYMKGFMKLLTFALKIGAHIAAGMGEMIPDLSREVAHLAGNPLVYGAAGVAAAGAVGVAAAGGSSSRGRSTDIQQDMKAAQQWVVDFLRERGCSTGKDIAEKFGLWRVRYRDDGQIAWVCRRHMYTRANEIFEVPM
ncbi:putative P-loop containing nucleoside triphosphate hydrolase, of Roc (COR) [Helianthus annuus]|nr:putative P-loop containing nucleoside triphosphate hydrolase, of Roc (COR) [Helianthus annuus]